MKSNDPASALLALLGGLAIFFINLAATIGGIWFLVEKLF